MDRKIMDAVASHGLAVGKYLDKFDEMIQSGEAYSRDNLAAERSEMARTFSLAVLAVLNSTSPTPPSTPTAGETGATPSGTPPTDRRE